MYPNVRAEMARQGLSVADLADSLNISLSTMYGKLRGQYPITLIEAKAIKKIVKSEDPIEKLFEYQEVE